MENRLRSIDLAVSAARKRQSPRTGYVHLHSVDETAVDTIPLFENFCFAIALFRQKTVESILEGKELVEKLLAFQTEGNFPIYLHDFPRCYDNWMALRIAPILVQIQRRFGAVIGADLKDKIASAIERLLKFAEKRSRPALWEHRFLKLQGLPSDFSPTSPEEWFHWCISEQLDSSPVSAKIPYHPILQVCVGGAEEQEKGEPRPTPLEWVLGEKHGFPERRLCCHPAALHSAILFPFEANVLSPTPFVWISEGVRLLWKGSKVHSLSAPAGKLRGENAILFELPHPVEAEKGDLIEAAIFCDLSSETEVMIEGKKGTVFHLGDCVQIRTPSLTVELRFILEEGQGDFCGQISRANRPGQTACKGALLYEVFDWRIAVRTLRRSPNCRIAASVDIYK